MYQINHRFYYSTRGYTGGGNDLTNKIQYVLDVHRLWEEEEPCPSVLTSFDPCCY